MKKFEDLKIAVAGTGYVGLSIATLLSQKHQVVAVDVIPEKVEKINNRISPIQDEYIEKYFAEKELNLPQLLMVHQPTKMQIMLLLPHLQITIQRRIFSIRIILRM